MFLQTLQNSQENTCARVSFFTKLLIYSVQKQSVRCVPYFCEIPKNTFSYRTPPVAASEDLTLSKKRLHYRCFLLLSHNTFFIEPFGRLLLHNHLFCLLSHHELSPFQKRCHTYFPAGYFLGLRCRLRKRMSSIFQPVGSHHRSKKKNE